MRFLQSAFLLLLALALLGSSVPASKSAAQGQPLAFPDGFMRSVKEWGAVGDGVTDDTAAIQRALDEGRSENQDYFGRPKALYFPAGIYLVSDTLAWRGCCVTLQGAGSGHSIIRLRDGAAGYGDPASPKAMIVPPAGNMSFRQNVWNMGFDTGSNNPGAVALDYIASNSGSVREVAIRSGDGRGVAGISLTRAWPGPLLVKDVQVDGFDFGILVGQPEYGPTFENITVRNQRVAGLRNVGNNIAVRRLTSVNSVPAVQHQSGMAMILDSNFSGGAAGVHAIESNATLYVRNVSTGGYASAIRQRGTAVPGVNVSEYTSERIYSLFDSPQRMLNLPINETPAFNDANMANWGRFEPRWYGDTGPLQALFNSGKSTIYFPFSAYLAFDEAAITVPPGVRRVIGFSSVINSDARGRNGGGIRLVVADNSTEPLIVEQFGYGMKIEQRGSRPVVIKHGQYDYFSSPGAGDLYLEDVVLEPLLVQPGQRVWARQFNNEFGGTKIRNQGGHLWILGLKTERAGTVIETTGGGKTELLGTLLYPAARFTAAQKQEAAFINRDSSVALIYGISNYLGADGYYDFQVEETRAGVTRRLRTADTPGDMPMYVGFTEQMATPPPGMPTPTPPTAGRQRVFLPLVRR
jgi:hypothetical protein